MNQADERSECKPDRAQQVSDVQYIQQRAAFRLSMIADEPVYLLLSMDGVDIDPIVDELSAGGARLVCNKHFDRFYEGQLVGPAVLVLQDEGLPVVYPVVKWKSWPVVGVEFMDIGDKEREMLYRFLFRLERKKVTRT